jgi:hypothetical protein
MFDAVADEEAHSPYREVVVEVLRTFGPPTERTIASFPIIEAGRGLFALGRWE